MDWLDRVLPVVSLLIGTVIPVGYTYVTKRSGENREALAVEKAITAEVEAIVRTVEARDYLRMFSSIIDEIGMHETIENTVNHTAIEHPDTWIRLKGQCQINIGSSYNRIYVAHIDKLGLLDPDFAKDVVTFYAYMDSVARDVTPGGILYEGAYIEDFKQSAFVLQRSLFIGEAIVNGKGHISENLRRNTP